MSTRIFNVTAGDKEYASAVVTERHNASLATTTWEVGVGSATTRPASWSTAVVETVSDSSVRVKLLIGTSGYTTLGTDRWLWVKPTDSPETFAVRVRTGGSFDIV